MSVLLSLVVAVLLLATVGKAAAYVFRHAPIDGRTCGWSGCPYCHKENR